MIIRVRDSKHPLVASHGTHASADLIGQRLDSQLMVGPGQRATDSQRGSLNGLFADECINRLGEPASQNVLVGFVGEKTCIGLRDSAG